MIILKIIIAWFFGGLGIGVVLAAALLVFTLIQERRG